MKTAFLAVSIILSLSGFSMAQEGKPQPLVEGGKYTILIKINMLRATRNATQMECIRFWNDSMAEYAQEVANNCSSVPPSSPKYPVAISVASSLPSAMEFSSIDWIGMWYDEKTRLCNRGGMPLISPEECQNYRQFYWYEGDEVGCAASSCGNITPRQSSLPEEYRGGPILLVCAFSSRRKPLCGDSTMNLCCDVEYHNYVVPSARTTVPSVVPSGGGASPKQENQTGIGKSTNSSEVAVPENVRANVFLYKDNIMGRHVIAFQGVESTFPRDIQRDPMRYTRIGTIGSIVKQNESLPGCKTLKPIHQLYSLITGETIYVAEEKELSRLPKLGYVHQGIIGQTVSELKECDAKMVVYTRYGIQGGEISGTNMTTDVTVISERLFPKYRFIRTNFLTWDPTGNVMGSSGISGPTSGALPSWLNDFPSSASGPPDSSTNSLNLPLVYENGVYRPYTP